MKQEIKSESISTMHSDNTVGMTMDHNSIRHLLKVLTDMYPDEDMAIIREYATNAYDSHVEAAQTRPIEVTLPTKDSPFYIVQDWGVGMGEWELTKVYGVYGKSTKRDSNEALGAFGLGSKSALASIDAFQLVSIKNGKKFNVLVDKDAYGVGQLRILKTTDTDEPNGVTVKIPVALDKIDSFKSKVETLFLLWEDGTALVDGQKPKSLKDVGYHTIPGIGHIAYEGGSGIKVAMGGLVYKMDGLDYYKQSELFKDASSLRYKNIIIEAGIGDVAISPARESILSSGDNIRYVRNKINAMYKHLVENAEKDIDAAENPIEAMNIIHTFDFLRLGTPSYRGAAYNPFIDTNLEGFYWNKAGARRKKLNERLQNMKLRISPKTSKSLFVDTHGTGLNSEDFFRYVNELRAITPEFAGECYMYVGDFSKHETDVFVNALVEAGKFVIIKADDARDQILAHRKANKGMNPNAGVKRGSLTYPVYTHNGDKNVTHDDMTIADLRDFDSLYMFFDENDLELNMRVVFAEHGKKGDVVVVVGKTRSPETLETRLQKTTKIKPVAPYLEKSLRKGLKPLAASPEEAKAHAIFFSGHGPRSFVQSLAPVKDELKSPQLKSLIEFDRTAVSEAIKHNMAIVGSLHVISRGMSHNEKMQFVEVGTSGSEDFLEKFNEHYQFAMNALPPYYNEKLTKSAVLFLNALYEAEGDPS